MLYLFDFLLTHLSSSISTPFQRISGLASSSSKVPADQNASASDGANASAKVRHILHLLSMVLYCHSFGNLSPFWPAQICAKATNQKENFFQVSLLRKQQQGSLTNPRNSYLRAARCSCTRATSGGRLLPFDECIPASSKGEGLNRP